MNEELKVVEVSISRAERDDYLKSAQASLDKYDDYFALPVGTHDEIREKVKAARAMNDKELLEKAAKAAGYVHLTEWADRIRDWDSEHMGGAALHARGAGGQCKSFNSITDDGDAFRLRNKLRMDVFYTDQGVNVVYDDVLLAFEPWGDDDLETERRAITRAAAAMVKE